MLHYYNATAPVFRRVVFRQDEAATIRLAVDAAKLIRELAAAQPETQWTFQYSPEAFSGTELPFVLQVCEAVLDAWEPTPANKAILNLPATVEVATPNIYADQIEWFCRHLKRRDSAIISLHPHNDRGTAVAAAELGIMAGADRVEGTLFANGERTGNVDLVTLALNLYTQGIAPASTSRTSTRWRVAWSTATSCPSIPGIRTWATWCSLHSRVRTRTPSRKALPPAATTMPGRFRICPSIRATSDAAMNRSSA